MPTPVLHTGHRLRAAINAQDFDELTQLLHPELHWEPSPPAHPEGDGREAALAWYRERLQRGIRVHVDEVFAYPDALVLGVRLTYDGLPRPGILYRVCRLHDGQVIRIRDFLTRADALAAADRPARQLRRPAPELTAP